jgi:hypothetical protein
VASVREAGATSADHTEAPCAMSRGFLLRHQPVEQGGKAGPPRPGRSGLRELHPRPTSRKPFWQQQLGNFEPLPGSASAARPRHRSTRPGNG